MSVPIVVAALVFLACLAGAAWLGRAQRRAAALASMVAAPVIAAFGFAAVATLPAAGTDAHTPEVPSASAGGAGAAPSIRPDSVNTQLVGVPGEDSEIDGWRREAEALRLARRYAEARVVYAKLVAAAPDDANAWADLGDASAAAAGGDLTAGAEAIDRALRVDPAHPKALWLKASLELQQKHYQRAMDLWQRLLAQLPGDSNDARIVSANLEETRALASRRGAAPVAATGDGR